MPEMLASLKDMQLPTILIIAGIVCIVWGIVGEISPTISQLRSHMQRVVIGSLGGFFIFLSLLIYLLPLASTFFTPHSAFATPTPTLTPIATIVSKPDITSTDTSTPLTHTDPIVSDSLQQNGTYTWIENDTCVFREHAYHVLDKTPNGPSNECYAQALPSFTNTQKITVQVEMRIVSGNYGGIGFGTVGGNRYFFDVNATNQYQIYYPGHGWFACTHVPQIQMSNKQILCPTSSYSPTGLIKLQIVIQQNTVSFYINNQLNWVGPNVGIVPGTVIFNAGYFQNNADLSFQNLKIWQTS